MPGNKKKNPIFGITIRRFIEGKYALGFKGDNRGPSLSYKAGYRTAATLFFDLEAGKQFTPIVGSTTGTTYVGYGLLDAISPDAFAMADVSTKGSMFIGNANSVYGRIRTSASDPLVPLSPDLDTVLTFKAVITGDLLTLSGQLQGDSFTGAEVIITYKDGREFLLTHKSKGTLVSLGEKYLKDLGKFTKKYIVDEDGFIIEELAPLDPRYKDLSNTLFDKSDGPTLDVFLPPVTQAYQSEEVKPVLHLDDLVWRNNEPTTEEVKESVEMMKDAQEESFNASEDEPSDTFNKEDNEEALQDDGNEIDGTGSDHESSIEAGIADGVITDLVNRESDNSDNELVYLEDKSLETGENEVAESFNMMADVENNSFNMSEDEPSGTFSMEEDADQGAFMVDGDNQNAFRGDNTENANTDAIDTNDAAGAVSFNMETDAAEHDFNAFEDDHDGMHNMEDNLDEPFEDPEDFENAEDAMHSESSDGFDITVGDEDEPDSSDASDDEDDDSSVQSDGSPAHSEEPPPPPEPPEPPEPPPAVG